jgi:RNA polymerase sigma factor (sigma-70 family)
MHRLMSQSALDNTAFAALYQRYWLTVLNYVRQRISSREDAEDILLESFLAALENEKSFLRLSEKQQLAWLRRVALNKCIDQHRRVKRRPAVPLEQTQEMLYESDDSSPEREALRQEERTLLRTRLSVLPELQREVLHLRFAYNLPCAEIARLLHKNEGAIRTLLSRSLNRLRAIYETSREEGHHG